MKLAILGTENSHAAAFARLIRDDPDLSCFTVAGAYGYDEEANRKLAREGLVTEFGKRPEDFLGRVDGILVTARHGDLHYEYAMPYIEKGIPAFIDKPITVKEELADSLFSAAEKSGALLCGGSSLKFLRKLDGITDFIYGRKILGGSLSAPVSMVNDYAGFYFYSQHLVEMLLRVFGGGVKRLFAYCPDERENRVTVLFDYGPFDVTAHYYAGYEYTVTVHTDGGTCSMHTYDLGDIYKRELMEYRDMVLNGRLPHSFEELRLPGKLMRAIEASYKTGKMVEP